MKPCCCGVANLTPHAVHQLPMIKWRRCWWKQWRRQRHWSPKWVWQFRLPDRLFCSPVIGFLFYSSTFLSLSLSPSETSSSKCLRHHGDGNRSPGSAKGCCHDCVPHAAASPWPYQDGVWRAWGPFRNTGKQLIQCPQSFSVAISWWVGT